jgi:hypothetical protein
MQSAWELDCHVSLTTASQIRWHLRLTVDTRQVPLVTLPSGTQWARCQLGPGSTYRCVCGVSLVRESARERVDALDAEVLPFPLRWYVPVPGAHPAPRTGICKHVFDRTVNKTSNGLEDLAELTRDVFSSTYLNRTSQRVGPACEDLGRLCSASQDSNP